MGPTLLSGRMIAVCICFRGPAIRYLGVKDSLQCLAHIINVKEGCEVFSGRTSCFEEDHPHTPRYVKFKPHQQVSANLYAQR